MKKEGQKTWQELADEFHMLMGYCIAEWATVDESLFMIFRDCVGPYEQCAIIYYRSPGLDIRLNLTDEIVRSILPKHKPGEHPADSVKEWDSIKKNFSNLLSVRRRIAHQPVNITFIPGRRVAIPTVNKEAFARYSAQPQPSFDIFASKHEEIRGKQPSKPLQSGDLEDHLLAVDELNYSLRRFLEVLTAISA